MVQVPAATPVTVDPETCRSLASANGTSPAARNSPSCHRPRAPQRHRRCRTKGDCLIDLGKRDRDVWVTCGAAFEVCISRLWSPATVHVPAAPPVTVDPETAQIVGGLLRAECHWQAELAVAVK